MRQLAGWTGDTGSPEWVTHRLALQISWGHWVSMERVSVSTDRLKPWSSSDLANPDFGLGTILLGRLHPFPAAPVLSWFNTAQENWGPDFWQSCMTWLGPGQQPEKSFQVPWGWRSQEPPTKIWCPLRSRQWHPPPSLNYWFYANKNWSCFFVSRGKTKKVKHSAPSRQLTTVWVWRTHPACQGPWLISSQMNTEVKK